MNSLLIKWALQNWKVTALVVAVLTAGAELAYLKRQWIQIGVLQQEKAMYMADADSLEKLLQRNDTQYVHDTVTVRKWLTAQVHDTLWRRDTIFVPGDTVARLAVPVKTVARTDSLVQKCSEALLSDCAQFRVWATKEIADLRNANAATVQIQRVEKPSLIRRVGEDALMVFVGYTVAKHVR